MSSNTLRGIGREGGGDGRDSQADGPNPAPAGEAKQPAATAGVAEGETAEPVLDVRKVRSLDSTIPGTRSLDASVPEARPSLDGKVPSLAATMLGMTAASVPGANAGRAGAAGRDKGTVQGRDVHLPVELQRRAGPLPVAGAVDGAPRPEAAAPQAIDHSEPTIADPVRVEHGAPELNSHAPWYDQEPVGSNDYDDPKPSLIGRVAIGAAVAASLAVILFAIVRVRVQGAAQEAEAAQAPPMALPAPPPAPTEMAPAAIPIPIQRDPADPGLFGGEQLPVEPSDDFPAGTNRAGDGALAPRGPSRPSTLPGGRNAAPAVSATRTAGTSSPRLPSPAPASSGAVGRPPARSGFPGEPSSATSPPAAVAAPVPSAPAATAPAPVAVPSANAPTPGPAGDDSPAADPAAKAAAPAKPKGKTYDPDSTLPLNFD